MSRVDDEQAEELTPELVELAGHLARHVQEFLQALDAIATEAEGSEAVSLLLLQVSQVLLCGAQLGAQVDFKPEGTYQPDVGPDADLDPIRLRLAELLGPVDTYSFVFDPYQPEVVESQLSDDMVSIAADLDNGLRHFREGNLLEALWWWQFSYVSNWGNLAGAALNALWAIVSHDRLDTELEISEEVLALADSVSPSEEPATP